MPEAHPITLHNAALLGNRGDGGLCLRGLTNRDIRWRLGVQRHRRPPASRASAVGSSIFRSACSTQPRRPSCWSCSAVATAATATSPTAGRPSLRGSRRPRKARRNQRHWHCWARRWQRWPRCGTVARPDLTSSAGTLRPAPEARARRGLRRSRDHAAGGRSPTRRLPAAPGQGIRCSRANRSPAVSRSRIRCTASTSSITSAARGRVL